MKPCQCELVDQLPARETIDVERRTGITIERGIALLVGFVAGIVALLIVMVLTGWVISI